MSDDNLKGDLFYSLLLINKVINGPWIKKMIQKERLSRLSELYLYQKDFLNEHDLTSDQFDLWKKFTRTDPYRRFSEYVEYTENKGIHSCDILDDVYPECLKVFPNMPVVLYYKGDMSLLDKNHSRVSIVGTRRPSSYGRRVTRDFSGNLARHDIVIVSGLARGIDGIAHMACLESGGKTIAVLPCGLDICYPQEHLELCREAARTGLVISELAPGQQPIRQYFPARNRILSAVADCVLIVEAGQNSGTLHTASFAAAQGKEVFTIPSIIYSDTAKGNLSLMKDGATVATEPEDILAYLANVVFFREIDEIKESYERQKLEKKIKEDPESLQSSEIRYVICDLLTSCELSLDEIVKASGIPYLSIVSELGKMELEGKITKERQKYILTIRF
ncbi:MAG: DNA-processing protein DprA [Clostridiales bacterium]|nr:DNA-processing protein DprA [Clostridiales bacterium]